MASHPHRQTTRADVARLAGVSTAVVSYVINGGPRGVSPEARAKVELAIEQLGYRPNPSARALKTGSTGLVGVVVPEVLNSFFGEFIEALDEAARARGSSIMLGITHDLAERESGLVWSLIDRGVDSVVFAGYLHDERLYRAGGDKVTRVLLDRSFSSAGLETIGSDAAEGTRTIVSHLADHGHRRIGFIGAPLPRVSVDLRQAAWMQILRERHLDAIDPVMTSWNRHGGYEGMRSLLALDEPPTAVFAASDFIAIGALHALHEVGLRVPEDVAVVSFDGTMESQYSWPPLTTVRHPYARIAESALDILSGPQRETRHLSIPMDLIIRNSCGCPAPTTIL